MVLAHLAAFNSHDTEKVLRGLADTVVWATGSDVLHGKAALTDVFDDGLWDLGPHLDLQSLIVEGDSAAARCTETMAENGQQVMYPLAIFF